MQGEKKGTKTDNVCNQALQVTVHQQMMIKYWDDKHTTLICRYQHNIWHINRGFIPNGV
jgi:hypothetical protein